MPASIVTTFAKTTGKTVPSVEKLWDKAKDIAAKNGHKEDYEYITGILKKMLRIEQAEDTVGTIKDTPILLETWGPDIMATLLTETMPASVKANLAMRWLEVEKQLRNIPSGTVSWPTLARALRQGMYALLNWASNDRSDERYKKFVGII